VLLLWRRDPHDDHRAVWALFTAALNETPSTARRLEYQIWSRVHPGPNDLPRLGESRAWRYEIDAVRRRKRASILAHRSQTTGMIDDAELGECLTADVLRPFFEPWEPFIEITASGPDASPIEATAPTQVSGST
jgi:LmbE family N-acetylglucosaminyl deacetylase